MKNIIKINKNNLIFRDEIKIILKDIKSNRSKTITLDFKEVNFISRSFADELLNIIDNLKKEKIIVKVINLKTNPAKLIKIVQKTKKKIKNLAKRN